MRFVLIAAVLFGASAPAYAEKFCSPPVGKKWLTLAQIRALVLQNGYDGFRIGFEAGCFEAEGIKDGKKLEVYFDPISGKVVRVQGDSD